MFPHAPIEFLITVKTSDLSSNSMTFAVIALRFQLRFVLKDEQLTG